VVGGLRGIVFSLFGARSRFTKRKFSLSPFCPAAIFFLFFHFASFGEEATLVLNFEINSILLENMGSLMSFFGLCNRLSAA